MYISYKIGIFLVSTFRKPHGIFYNLAMRNTFLEGDKEPILSFLLTLAIIITNNNKDNTLFLPRSFVLIIQPSLILQNALQLLHNILFRKTLIIQ